MKKGRLAIIFGWILLALQGLSMYGSQYNGGLNFQGVAGLFQALGYFSFGILGIVLLIVGYRRRASCDTAEKKECHETGNDNRGQEKEAVKEKVEEDSKEKETNPFWKCPTCETVNEGIYCVVCNGIKPGLEPDPIASEKDVTITMTKHRREGKGKPQMDQEDCPSVDPHSTEKSLQEGEDC